MKHQPKEWVQDLTRRSIKILDIGYITIIYFYIGFFLSNWIDQQIGEFDPEAQQSKSTGRLLSECILHVYMIAVLTYLIRNIVPLIPFPLDGIYGYSHSKVKELTSAAVFVFVFYYYQSNLRKRLAYIASRFHLKITT